MTGCEFCAPRLIRNEWMRPRYVRLDWDAKAADSVGRTLRRFLVASRHGIGVAERAGAGASRDLELAWLGRQAHLSDRFGGQWIVVEGDRLVAHSFDYEIARAGAEARGIVRPFIIFIPRPEREAFMGL